MVFVGFLLLNKDAIFMESYFSLIAIEWNGFGCCFYMGINKVFIFVIRMSPEEYQTCFLPYIHL